MKHFHHGFCGNMISLDTCEGLTTTEMLCTISAKLNDIMEYYKTFDDSLTSTEKPCTAKAVGDLAKFVTDLAIRLDISGITAIEQTNALNEMFKVCVYKNPDISAQYNAFKVAFGIDDSDDSDENIPDIEPDIPDIEPVIPDSPNNPQPSLLMDGLVDFFDFRTSTYNNNGDGNSTTIKSNIGNGMLFAWSNNMVVEQNEYGVKVNRSFDYSSNDTLSSSTANYNFTQIYKCYIGDIACSPFFNGEYGVLSNSNKMAYKPKYKTSNGEMNVTGEAIGQRLQNSYETIILSVDSETKLCKLYFNDTLVKTLDGHDIDGFVNWSTNVKGLRILGDINGGYLSQFALYDRALTDIEIVEIVQYLISLEVK